MREKYESLAVHDLKEIAKARGIKGLSTMKKAEVIDAMLRLDAQENAEMKTEPSAPKNRPAEREDTPKRGAAEHKDAPEKDAAERKDAPKRDAAEREDTPKKGAVEKQDSHDGGAEPESRAGDREERRQQRTGKRFISNGSYHNGRTGSRDNNGARENTAAAAPVAEEAQNRVSAPAPRYNERYNSPYNRGTARTDPESRGRQVPDRAGQRHYGKGYPGGHG